MIIIKRLSNSIRNYCCKSFIISLTIIATLIHYITYERGKRGIVTKRKIKRIHFFSLAKRITYVYMTSLCKYLRLYDDLYELDVKIWK